MTGQGKDKPKLTPSEMAAYAERVVTKTFQDSSLVDNTAEYPKFAWNEMKLGKVLGKGGFGTVYEVRAFATGSDSTTGSPEFLSRSTRSLKSRKEDMELDVGEAESRQFIADHCLRNGGDARYAVKQLSKEVVEDPSLFLQGIHDMAIETRFLSDMEHPNIIKMRAIASTSPYVEGYFIVMDRLYDTLEKRLLIWETRLGRCSGLAAKVMDRRGRKSAALYEERIVAAFDLAAALAYLHERKIIYRDLKPENIGFDIRGDIKIFDFGLAKELRPKLRNDDGTTYRLTGNTGSPRYMAPEVANSLPYNETCDVYSFAILLWEMMALKRPYLLYTPKSMRECVYNGPHKRPFIDPSWHNSIKICLKRSWDADLHARNSMSQVVAILRKECVSARDGDETGLEHNRRRSTFVFRPNAKKASPRPVPLVSLSQSPSPNRRMSDKAKEQASSSPLVEKLSNTTTTTRTEHDMTEVDC